MLNLYKWKKHISEFQGNNYIAILSDKVDCGTFNGEKFISAETKTESEPDFTKLLELRVFNENMEYRAFRDNLGATNFGERIAPEDIGKYSSTFDEFHYLDIDSNRTENEGKDNELFTTGGGRYFLPEKENKRKVLVRTYLKADDYGMEYAADWRIVGYRDADFMLKEDQNA